MIYSSRSMFVQSQLRGFSSVILSNYINCLYTLGKRFFVWKVIYQCSLIFLIISRISFKMHLQIQPDNFSLVTTVKLHVYILYVCMCIMCILLLVVKDENIFRNTRKMHITMETGLRF